VSATPLTLLLLAVLTLVLPLGVHWLLRRRPALQERMQGALQRQGPSQEDFLIGFPLFIVFCGILMGWMLLFVGVVRQGMLR